jgi:sortase A
MRRAARMLGTVLIGSGVCLLLWALVVWRWQDPFTALYTLYQQHRLAASYDQRVTAYTPLPHPARGKDWVLAEKRLVAREATRYQRTLKEGDPLGRLVVPRLHLNMITVAGTSHDSLTKGPGWYRGTYLPGEGQLIYIAGHRTTYLAPFAHIDELRRGDRVTLEMPYATFVYAVARHVVVPAGDVSRLRSHGYEVLALQACHPRFFATHRYIAYALPIRVEPRGGRPYSIGSARLTARSLRLSTAPA